MPNTRKGSGAEQLWAEIKEGCRIDNEDFREIVEIVGLDAAKKLARVFGGNRMYIPGRHAIIKHERNKRIRKEFNGCNYVELADKYCLSARQVRNIINKKGETEQWAKK